ncbi:hypothetical protein [Megamonas funiformis]|nr:hypothetical protein [Megamonas funiformis]
MIEVAKSNVTRGHTKSCGCLKLEHLKKARAMRTIKKTTKYDMHPKYWTY